MSAESAASIRRRYVFHGRVQGVFFRATSAEIAERHPVVGFVRNLPAGTVELEAEGAASAVDAFVAEIQAHFVGNITDVESAEMAATGVDAEFRIRH